MSEPSQVLDLLLIARHGYGGYPPLGDWQMARALARRHRVLYVEPPDVMRRPERGGVARLRHPRVRQTPEGVHVLRPAVVPGAARRGTSRLGDLLLQKQVREASNAVFAAPPVLLVFDPLRGGLPRIERSRSVYWRRDLFRAHPSRTVRLLAARDRELLASSDLVTCVSRPLTDDARQTAGDRVHYLPNGCDPAHFASPRDRPPGLPVADVVVGVMGGAAWRVDFDLLTELAIREPGWSIVLVGGGSGRRLPPNVVEVPYVAYEDAPAWVQHFDVGLVPYDSSSDFNQASFPLKALESLAAGVPVVSTPLAAFADLDPWVRTAGDAEGIAAAIRRARADGPAAQACREVGAAQSWDDRASRLIDLIMRGGSQAVDAP